MKKITPIICALMAGFIALMPSTKVQGQEKQVNTFSLIHVKGDGTPANPQYLIIVDNLGTIYKVKHINQEIREMLVNGQPVPERQLAGYDWLLKAVDGQIKKSRAQAQEDKKQAERH